MKGNKKLAITISIYVILLALIALTLVFHDNIYGAIGVPSIFAANPARSTVLNTLIGLIPALITSICVLIGAFFILAIVKSISDFFIKKISNKAKTVITLMRSLFRWIVIIAVIIIILQAFGVDMTTLLAGLGIVALTIGLGAQQIVADIIAGFFIVFEAEYKVGDIITIDGWRGTVSDIGIRVTKIIDASGNIKIVNNSDIKTVINLTAELSVAFITVSIDYEEDLRRVELVLRDNLAKIKDNVSGIIDGPYYKGVSALGESSVDLLFAATCKESEIYQVKRDINRQIFLLFNEHKITIPFKQVTISERPSGDAETAKSSRGQAKREREATEFISEQSNLSKNLDKDNNG
ncbi:MAG: mechanosensitive ion channel family protein [Clostridia bacterium]|nr:mechanosensitive ion channel family protein [Clostridia bacterium]